MYTRGGSRDSWGLREDEYEGNEVVSKSVKYQRGRLTNSLCGKQEGVVGNNLGAQWLR